MLIKQPWPDKRPWRERSERARPFAPAIAPLAERDERHRGHREQAGANEALRQESNAGAGAEDPARSARKPIDADRNAGEKRVVGDELVRVLQVAERGAEEKRGGPSGAAAIEAASGQPGEGQRQRDIKSGGEACRIVQRHEPAEWVGKKRGGPEEKRWLLDEWLARERRHEPVARLADVVDEAERIRLGGLPRIVAEQARKEPRDAERAERCVAPHAASAIELGAALHRLNFPLNSRDMAPS